MNTEIDLVNKVKYYLDHPEERIEIANRGCEKVTKNYNAEVFWKTVFKRVGI
jgi:spore maturation protein CgeB